MKKLILILGLLTLCLNFYAFDFLGVEIAGNVEDVADKLAEKGFYRAKGIVQDGPDKGKEEIIKFDNLLLLKGNLKGEKVNIMLMMENKNDIITGCTITFINIPSNRIESFYNEVTKDMIMQFGSPNEFYDSRIPYTKEEKEYWKDWSDTMFARFWNNGVAVTVEKDSNEVSIFF